MPKKDERPSVKIAGVSSSIDIDLTDPLQTGRALMEGSLVKMLRDVAPKLDCPCIACCERLWGGALLALAEQSAKTLGPEVVRGMLAVASATVHRSQMAAADALVEPGAEPQGSTHH